MKYLVIFLIFFANVGITSASEPEPDYPLEFPKFISGIPILQKYTVTNEPDYYHEIDASQYDWAMRIIEQGYASVTENELREFWSFVSKEGNFNFAITLHDDTVKYIKIQFNDALLRDDQHYIRTFPLYQETLEKFPHIFPEKHETISLSDHSWLRIPVHDPYSWKPMPDYAIVDYKKLVSNGTYYFEIVDGNNTRLYNIQYAGIGLESNRYDIQSPLKQFNLGIPLNKIQCKDSLTLIERYDGSPACVESDTVQVLMERGWTSSIAKVKTMPDLPPNKISNQIKDVPEIVSNSRVIILKGAASSENPSLKPVEINVVLGNNGTVSWINEDDVVHTMVSDDKNNPWSTGTIRPGESSSVTFNNTGIFTYHGFPGPWIKGKIIASFDNGEISSDGILDSHIIKYSPVLFKGTGIDLKDEDLVALLKQKQKQISNAFSETEAKRVYPIHSIALSIGLNAYSLDEKFIGNPSALEIRVLKDEFTKTNLEKLDQFVRKYVGEEIDVVYLKR